MIIASNNPLHIPSPSIVTLYGATFNTVEHL